eukprot:7584104-Pyramimonas_sp.AAC.1
MAVATQQEGKTLGNSRNDHRWSVCEVEGDGRVSFARGDWANTASASLHLAAGVGGGGVGQLRMPLPTACWILPKRPYVGVPVLCYLPSGELGWAGAC